MAPKDYRAAREDAANGGGDCLVVVDGRPYLPSVSTDEKNSEASIRRILGGVFGIDADAGVEIQTVTGGQTNKLFRVSGLATTATPEEVPDAVLVRIFGGHGLIDRDVETSTYAALAEQGIALEYYGRFGNGRLEEWAGDRMRHLEVAEMGLPSASKGIAQELARLHAGFDIPEHLHEFHCLDQTPTLWSQLSDWLDQASAAEFASPADASRAASLGLDRLRDELEWLQHGGVCHPDAQVGFCHNDLLAANVLWAAGEDDDDKIQLIDFEYGGINYFSYDIANHFNEFAGGTTDEENGVPDYSLFPSEATRRAFCAAYLAAAGRADDPAAVENLLQEIGGFVLANHLVWGLWGINQAATEGSEGFNYMEYGTRRIQRYFHEKEEWLRSDDNA